MNITGSFPIVITKKLKESQDFYTENFGFTTVFEADWYLHMRHGASNVEIGFMAPDLENQPPGLRDAYKAKGIIFSLETDNAKQCYETLKKKGLPFVLPLKDEEWGQRHCIVADPTGLYIDIVEQLSQ
jgi:uncharacterized glyoxalase superfamily protein PhnB